MDLLWTTDNKDSNKRKKKKEEDICFFEYSQNQLTADLPAGFMHFMLQLLISEVKAGINPHLDFL